MWLLVSERKNLLGGFYLSIHQECLLDCIPIGSIIKSSWEIVKEFMVDGDKTDLLAERAKSILHYWIPTRFHPLSRGNKNCSFIRVNAQFQMNNRSIIHVIIFNCHGSFIFY
jgi:hypothetical protein